MVAFWVSQAWARNCCAGVSVGSSRCPNQHLLYCVQCCHTTHLVARAAALDADKDQAAAPQVGVHDADHHGRLALPPSADHQRGKHVGAAVGLGLRKRLCGRGHGFFWCASCNACRTASRTTGRFSGRGSGSPCPARTVPRASHWHSRRAGAGDGVPLPCVEREAGRLAPFFFVALH